MQRTPRFCFLVGVLTSCLLASCSTDRSEHRQVARSFVEQLNRCLNEPNQANRDELAQFCSAYTWSLAQNASWAKRLVPPGKLNYLFLRDSLSHDQMKAYVWFSNTQAGADPTHYCIELRQSIGGWLVDMPLL